MGILEHRGRGGISRTLFRNLEGHMYPWRTDEALVGGSGLLCRVSDLHPMNQEAG